MAKAKLGALALLRLAAFGDAQLVFMFPQHNGEDAPTRAQPPAHVTFSSVSALGQDGQMHTETHKVFTQTSDDGLQKRISEVDCKDGDCSKSVSHFFKGLPRGAFASMSMAPSSLFNKMPDLPRMPRMGMDMPAMHAKMQAMMDSMPAPEMNMGMSEKLQAMMSRIRNMHQGMRQQMPSKTIIRIMPLHLTNSHFLAPRPPSEAAVEDPTVDGDGELLTMVVFLGTVVLGIVTALAYLIIKSCVGKAPARERRLQALGQPLVPEDQAELGMTTGVAVRRQAPKATAQPTPTQMYLLDVYARAGKPADAAEMATVVLHNVYAKALERVAAV
mmetsp:Transcript_30381/g.56967  ORF Transcript_30381/g.56967 Transcript_30381/m.56967 type:complete len:330 (-) Transcript_30381:99-1088(-)